MQISFEKKAKYDYMKVIILYLKSLLYHLLTFIFVKFWFCFFFFLKVIGFQKVLSHLTNW